MINVAAAFLIQCLVHVEDFRSSLHESWKARDKVFDIRSWSAEEWLKYKGLAKINFEANSKAKKDP